jgi:DNA-binding LytR/AlgR family response regulator
MDTSAAPGIRAVIADDEPLARRGIRQLLEAHPDITVVSECRNGRETVRAVHALSPDLVFLDVQMPVLDGFGVLREVGAARMPAVVFVTAYEEFALRAFEEHALDYLVKPVSEARFAAAIAHVRERLRSAHAVDLARRLEALLAAHGHHLGRPAGREVRGVRRLLRGRVRARATPPATRVARVAGAAAGPDAVRARASVGNR